MQEKRTKRTPIREIKVDLSSDRKYFLFRDTTTWIFPVNYLATILQAKGGTERLALSQTDNGTAQGMGEGNGRGNREGN